MNKTLETTATVDQLKDSFSLIYTQLESARVMAEKGAQGKEIYRPALHIIGICAYINELACHIKASVEMRKP